ncbi:ribonuclease J [Xylocopilactobacillus apis]|uniref:Ribonuclease J n=1 Tax=Xylocopilactobacillus apis TaxID=2932183 RepID=A0AAU9CXN7_9LACO|nr:ribonuclease J [Xylocopilactobacillus apis]BDR57186.1 ribonuclease J [Xylocopilactobacillus apis]
MGKVKIAMLGGVREDGKNIYAVDADGEIFVLDFGLKYPENEMLGIDVVVPDFNYLEENIDRIAGVFLTHGHADAIGALPYFLHKGYNVPIFGSKLTIELVKNNIIDQKMKNKYSFNVINEKSEIDFEKTTVSFFKTTHTIPDSLGIVLNTSEGKIVYTGDFKFDFSQTGPYETDLNRLAKIGESNVIALLSDSSNAEAQAAPYNTDREVTTYINETFKYQAGRIIVASVASNIVRIQQIINAAVYSQRKLAISGRDLEKIVRTAMKLKYLKIPDGLLIPLKDLKKYQDDQVVILETGKLGEPMKSLQRMATGRYKNVRIKQGDLVFITSSPSYAMETSMAKTKDLIYRAGAEVKTLSDDINATGHASRYDLQMLIKLIHPKYLVPIQGEYRLLDAHKEIAKEAGIPEKNIFITAMGDVLEIKDEEMHLGKAVPAGDTMIDGIGVGDIGSIVLRDRKMLSEDGVFVSTVTIDRRNKKIISTPKIVAKGFVYNKTNQELLNDSKEVIKKSVLNYMENDDFDWSEIKQDVRDDLNKFLFEQTKRHPVILPVIMEVNQNKSNRQ